MRRLDLTDPFAIVRPVAPYPGLRPFQSSEWPIFFGREEATRAVIEKLVRDHVCVVHGDSGCGKSSLIRAGVLVQLQQGHATNGQSWRTAVLLPRGNPLDELAKALSILDNENSVTADDIRPILDDPWQAPMTASIMLRHNNRLNLCILVDQFEEIFRYSQEVSKSHARQFVEFITSAAESPIPGLYIVVTMRSEFLGACARFDRLANVVNRCQYLLPKMNRHSLRRAIHEPARRYAGRISDALAEQLMDGVVNNQDELPLIQHGLMHLYFDKVRKIDRKNAVHNCSSLSDTREVDWMLNVNDFSMSEGLTGILSMHAQSLYCNLSKRNPRYARIIEHVFRALTDFNLDGQGVRRPQSFVRLCEITNSTPEVMLEILDAFRANNVSMLLPFEGVDIQSDTEIDISHESLIRSWRILCDEENGWLRSEFDDQMMLKSLIFHANNGSLIGKSGTEFYDEFLRGMISRDWSRRYMGSVSEFNETWRKIDSFMKVNIRIVDEKIAKNYQEFKKLRDENAILNKKTTQLVLGKRLKLIEALFGTSASIIVSLMFGILLIFVIGYFSLGIEGVLRLLAGYFDQLEYRPQ